MLNFGKMIAGLSFVSLVSGCAFGHCYEIAAHHLLDSDRHTRVVAREQFPDAFGTIQEVVGKYRKEGMEYGVWNGGNVSVAAIEKLLESGYRVVVVVPSWPVDHAVSVTDIKQVEGRTILMVHYSKEG